MRFTNSDESPWTVQTAHSPRAHPSSVMLEPASFCKTFIPLVLAYLERLLIHSWLGDSHALTGPLSPLFHANSSLPRSESHAFRCRATVDLVTRAATYLGRQISRLQRLVLRAPTRSSIDHSQKLDSNQWRSAFNGVVFCIVFSY